MFHRDIKPANVFIQNVAGEPFVKLLDFGVAKLTETDVSMTASGTVLGTPYYMSPEQFVAPRDIDGRADLWSVAVVAYECLTGDVPFVADTVGGMSLKVHRGEFARPSERAPFLPEAVDAWFLTALAPDPDARFQTAMDLAQSFARAVADVKAPGGPTLVLGSRHDITDEQSVSQAETIAADRAVASDAPTRVRVSDSITDAETVLASSDEDAPDSRGEVAPAPRAARTDGFGTLTGPGSSEVSLERPARSWVPMALGGGLKQTTSTARVTVPISAGGSRGRTTVTGPASNVPSFKACMIQAGGNTPLRDVRYRGTAAWAQATLPACHWDGTMPVCDGS